MPTLIFSVIPDVVPANPGDIILRTFANRSVINGDGIHLLVDQDIVLAAAFHNVSTFGEDTRLTSGDEFNIVLDEAFTNVSTFGEDTELTEAPPDEVILLDTFTNVSTFGTLTELTEAPPDEIIRLAAAFADPDSFGAATFLVIDTGGEEDDADAIAEGNPSETVPG